jgi:ferredoxin
MPWIKQEDCTRCGICIDICPTDAITMEEEGALIDMDLCIRCGECHEVCPIDAVRHDSERIPEEVEENIRWTMNLMKYYKTDQEIKEFIERIEKHFMKEKRVAELTLERLSSMK